jgi:hypothetical protein
MAFKTLSLNLQPRYHLFLLPSSTLACSSSLSLLTLPYLLCSPQVEGTTAKDVMDLLLLTQYFDTIKDIGHKTTGATLFLPHGPDSVGKLRDQLKNDLATHKS